MEKGNCYYVYAYLDPRKPGKYFYGKDLFFEFEPFYIGKGVGDRIKSHLFSVKNNRKSREYNLYKRRKINNIIKNGLDPLLVTVYKNLNEDVAYNSEILCISAIGRCNLENVPLTNLSDGGNGQRNLIHTQASKDKLSSSLKKFYANGDKCVWNKGKKGWHGTEESLKSMRQKVSEKSKGKKKKMTIEGSAAIAKAVYERNKGKKRSEETISKQKQSIAKRIEYEKSIGYKRKTNKGVKRSMPPWNKGLTKNDDPRVAKQGWQEKDKERARQLLSINNKGKKLSDDTRRRMSESLKGRKAWNGGVGLKTYKFIYNNQILIIDCLKKYCKENNLCRSSMCSLHTSSGAYKNKNYYKGYLRIENNEK